MVQAMLLDMKTGQVIIIDKPVFRIGREKPYVDYWVDETTVSRSHCLIISKDGIHMIVDCNSTNHTCVDDVFLPANEEHQLYHGAVINLADRQFMFMLSECEVK